MKTDLFRLLVILAILSMNYLVAQNICYQFNPQNYKSEQFQIFIIEDQTFFLQLYLIFREFIEGCPLFTIYYILFHRYVKFHHR